MPAILHFAAAGITRPACGDTTPGASVTSTAALVTCARCTQTITTLRQPTPHGRTN
ncbi:hypothetical protein QL996_01540 [Planococcus sp. APC 4015]|nr:hypothetical protein [Planococcus sp. APC 4015]